MRAGDAVHELRALEMLMKVSFRLGWLPDFPDVSVLGEFAIFIAAVQSPAAEAGAHPGSEGFILRRL